MPRQITKTVYQFDELSPEAQERAIEQWQEHGMDYEWYDCIYSHVKEIGNLLGIEIDNIYFSGFHSQGDGACFTGYYSFRRGAVKAVKEYAPQDKELHQIAQDLHAINAKCFYNLSAHVKHGGHRSHASYTVINVEDSRYYRPTEEAKDALSEVLRDFMHWIYRLLEKEYEYQTSPEYIAEMFMANEYEFYENGKIA
jgi:hypothetical protein